MTLQLGVDSRWRGLQPSRIVLFFILFLHYSMRVSVDLFHRMRMIVRLPD